MNRIDALESIKQAWLSADMNLGEKIMSISSDYYATGLDLAGTAAYIHATPSELDSLLIISEFDEPLIDLISEVNPPKTAWTFLASASEEEAIAALEALKDVSVEDASKNAHRDFGEYVYYMMLDIAGSTPEQRVVALSGDILKHALKKGQDFDVLNDWQKKFLNSVAAQKKRGKALSDKQAAKILEILTALADQGAITRNSIDGDRKECDAILDALGR